MEKKHGFETAHETRMIFDHLCAAEKGALITYQELSDLVGRSCAPSGPCYHNLSSARNMAQREKGYVFGAVRKQGVQRLKDCDIAVSWESDRDMIRRRAKRSARRVSCADYEMLTETEKEQLNIGQTFLAVVHESTKPRYLNRLAEAVTNAKAQLPVAKAIDIFRK